MAARPTPVRDVVAAVVSRFSSSDIGIEDSEHDAITFAESLADTDIDHLQQPIQNRNQFVVRCEGVRPGDNSIVGQSIWLFRLACYYYHTSAQQARAERSTWDVLLRTAQVVAEERAKPGGATGNGALFGLTSGINRVTDVIAEVEEMSVQPLDQASDDEPEFTGIVRGRYAFDVEYRMGAIGESEVGS